MIRLKLIYVVSVAFLISCGNETNKAQTENIPASTNAQAEIEQNRKKVEEQIAKQDYENEQGSLRSILETNIYANLEGTWYFEQRPTYEEDVEKLYTYIFTFSDKTVSTKRYYYVYTKAIGTSSIQYDKADFTETYRIKDINNLNPRDRNGICYLETSYEDKNRFTQFKIDYEDGKFKSISFQTLSSDWIQLTKK